MTQTRLTEIDGTSSFYMPILTAVMFIMVFLASVSSVAKEKPSTLLIWGDSLSAAYGMPIEKGWVQLLQHELAALKIINGSISGETTQGGLNRLPAALKTHKPDIVLIELGANDGLRGLPIATLHGNLTHMINAVKASQADVIIAEMKIPPNYGLSYTQKFEQTFQQLATTHEVVLIPFMLENIANNYALMQADGLHPTAEAQALILKQVKPVIEQVLKQKQGLSTSK